MDYTALKNEIQQGPQYASKGDADIAGLLNTIGTTNVTLASIDKDTFLLAIAPAYLSLPTLSDALQKKWDRILGVIGSAERITFTSTVSYLLSQAVTDGVLTQDQVSAVNQRPGTRAEVLFGAGTVVTQSDVSFALRGAR
jgi:hypothetical protein